MNYLVDANVLSEGTRQAPDANVISWLKTHEEELSVSVITLWELQRGISRYPTSRKRAALEKWLDDMLEAFEGRILSVDEEVASKWGAYYAEQEKKGRKPPTLDSLLAATARTHGLTVATRNAADFPDLPVTNPWEKEEL